MTTSAPDDDYPTCLETYSTLRVFSDHLPPDAISTALGVQATESFHKGDLFASGRLHRKFHGWSYSTSEGIESRDTRRHLDAILGLLAGKAEIVERLRREGCTFTITTFYISVGHGGPCLEAYQSKQLAELGIGVSWDVYFEREEIKPAKSWTSNVAPFVHDSSLLAYSVNGESQEVVLHLRPEGGDKSDDFAVVLRGTVAHCFEDPQLPAIVFDITNEDAESLLREEWERIERGRSAAGWPGPWASSLDEAIAFAKTSKLRAFRIDSSYGLSGWVLATGVEIVADVAVHGEAHQNPLDFEQVLDLLDAWRQRATYGAVAKLLERPARFLMQGRDRTPRNSWIVAADSLLPTGYATNEMHPELTNNDGVLMTSEELALWLRLRSRP